MDEWYCEFDVNIICKSGKIVPMSIEVDCKPEAIAIAKEFMADVFPDEEIEFIQCELYVEEEDDE